MVAIGDTLDMVPSPESVCDAAILALAKFVGIDVVNKPKCGHTF